MRSTNPQRVGYVLKMYPRFSETFILNEVLAHEAAELDLEIFSLRPPNDGRFHEALAQVRAPVTYLPSSRPNKVAELWQLLRETKKQAPNFEPMLAEILEEDTRDIYQALLLAREVKSRGLTHLHAHFGSVATTVTRLAARFTGIPYTFTAHAKDIYHESVRPADLQRKLTDAAAVVTVSKYNLAYLKQHYDLPEDNVHCIYNGLDLDQFPYISPDARPPKIVAVGRLVEKKGFTHLIDACKLLADQGRDFQAEIIGAGLLEANLRAQIDQLDVADQVTLIGPRPQGEVRRHVQQAAVFAAPCVIAQDGNRDGLPTVLLEAMALGTPCISTDVTGIPEVLRTGVTGLSVPQRDAEALAEALAFLLDDGALRVQVAMAARWLIETQFDVHHNAAKIRDLFTDPRKPITRTEEVDQASNLNERQLEVA